MNLSTVKIKDALFAILLVLVTKPHVVSRLPELDLIWDITVVLCFIYFTIYLFSKHLAVKSDILLALFCLLYCVITFFYSPENILGSISSCIRVWLAFSCIRLFVKKEKKSTLRIIAVVFSIELYIEFFVSVSNLLFMFLGDPRFSLLGYDNYSIFAIAPMLVVLFSIDYLQHERYSANSILLFSLMFVEKLATLAVTSIVVLFLVAVALYLIKRKNRLKSFFNHKSGFIILVSLSLLIVVFHAQDIFSPLFELMGKDSTISGRTAIWDATLNSILSSPIWGHGRQSPESFLFITGLPLFERSWGHAHNGILELLFTVGCIGLVLYIAFLASVFASRKSSGADLSQVREILLVGVFAYALLMFTDSYFFLTPFYCLLGIYEALSSETSVLSCTTE